MRENYWRPFWSRHDRERLGRLAGRFTPAEIGERLGIPKFAVVAMASHLGISLKLVDRNIR